MITAHAIAASRRDQARESRAVFEARVSREKARAYADKCKETLRGVVQGLGLPSHQGVSVIAAAESYAKALAALIPATAPADPEPVGSAGEGGAA